MRTRDGGSTTGPTGSSLGVAFLSVNSLERGNWSDKDGELYLPKESFSLPGKEWGWDTIWYIDKHNEFTDESGWTYAIDFTSNFHKRQNTFDVVRRRKWVRMCEK